MLQSPCLCSLHGVWHLYGVNVIACFWLFKLAAGLSSHVDKMSAQATETQRHEEQLRVLAVTTTKLQPAAAILGEKKPRTFRTLNQMCNEGGCLLSRCVFVCVCVTCLCVDIKPAEAIKFRC